jgi:hypothetical protein
MCLVIDTRKHKVEGEKDLQPIYSPRIAKKDIKCYKYLEDNQDGNGRSVIYKDQVWKKGELAEVTLVQTQYSHLGAYEIIGGYPAVKQGFHAFLRRDSLFIFNESKFLYDTSTTFNMADTSGSVAYTNHGRWEYEQVCVKMNAKMIIPKGAKYFIGMKGDIVANKMKLQEMF